MKLKMKKTVGTDGSPNMTRLTNPLLILVPSFILLIMGIHQDPDINETDTPAYEVTTTEENILDLVGGGEVRELETGEDTPDLYLVEQDDKILLVTEQFEKEDDGDERISYNIESFNTGADDITEEDVDSFLSE